MDNNEFLKFCNENNINISKNKLKGYSKLNKKQRIQYLLDKYERYENIDDFPVFMYKNNKI